MSGFQLASVLVSLAALFSFVNAKILRLPRTIGVTFLALLASLLLILLGSVWPGLHQNAARLVSAVDFHQTVLHGMLAFLLFAGALHLNFDDLRREWGLIAWLSLLGTAFSTLIVAGLASLAFRGLGIGMPALYCVLLGALISPTDPIAVLGIMKNVHAPRALEAQLAGESLFNDGVGVVIFLTALDLAMGGIAPTWTGLGLRLLKDVAGGIAIGLATGYAVYRLIKRVDDYSVEVLLTLALAMGGFSLAEMLHVSAPIEVVVAGLFIGNQGREEGMSAITREYLDAFWELIDEILNALLFLLIGLELLVMPLAGRWLIAGVSAIGIAMAARWISVAGIVYLARRVRPVERGTIRVLTWGGVRGGLSVAMALSLPRGEHRDVLVSVTYVVVLFAVFVQGLSVGTLIRRVMATDSLPS